MLFEHISLFLFSFVIPIFCDRVSFSSDFLVPENSTVTLFCDPLFNGGQTSAVWIKDGIVLGDVTQSKNLVMITSVTSKSHKWRYELEKVPEVGYLIIPAVRKEDQGSYWCESLPEGEATPSRSRSFNLKVAFISPTHYLQPILQFAQEHSTVFLFCNTPNAFPSPHLYWIKDESGEKIQYFGRIRSLPNGTLILNNFNRSDSGSYSCYAKNIAGVRKVQNHLLFPASIKGDSVHSLKQNQQIDLGDFCYSSRYFMSYLLWYIAGLLTTAVAVMGYGLFAVCYLKPHSRATIQPCCTPRPLHRWTTRTAGPHPV